MFFGNPYGNPYEIPIKFGNPYGKNWVVPEISDFLLQGGPWSVSGHGFFQVSAGAWQHHAAADGPGSHGVAVIFCLKIY